METKKPAHEVRIGRAKATIWPNQTEKGTRYSVSLGRLYKPEDGPWQTSRSLDRDDLLNAAKAIDLAHTWIISQASEEAGTGA